MTYEITGSVKQLTDIKLIGADGTLKVRTLVVHVEGEYPKDVAFELFGAKCDLILPIGQPVKVTFDVRSNQSRTDVSRWFTTAKMISVEPLAGSAPPQATDFPVYHGSGEAAGAQVEDGYTAAVAPAADDEVPF